MKNLGQRPTVLQQLLINDLLFFGSPDEIIVHHVSDTEDRLQLEIERRTLFGEIKFERVVI